MADVVVTVMVDGKQAFAHAFVGAPVAGDVVLAGLETGLAHFRACKAASTPAPQAQQSGAGQSAVNTKGP